MKHVLATLTLIITFAGCSGSGTPSPTPSMETRKPEATTQQDTDQTVNQLETVHEIDTNEAVVEEVVSGETPSQHSSQGMTVEEAADWAARVSEVGSLWRALAMCEPRFRDPIPQGGASEQAWLAALPFLSSHATRDCIITKVAVGEGR